MSEWGDIWSKHWTLSQAKTYYNDGTGEYTTNDTAACGSVKVNDFIIQPELSSEGGLNTIGVFAHEYGHVLGLPDLYDTDDPRDSNIASKGVGDWCLMGSGSWNKSVREGSRDGDSPAHFSAWCKYKLGWVKPTVVTGTLVNESINAASRQADVYQFLPGSPSTGGEYFLIENRLQDGFDIGLPGSGLAIWHIDEAKEDNTQECETATGCPVKHYKVALEQADGQFDLEKNVNEGYFTDLYGLTREFKASSVPNSLLYSGRNYQLSVTDISVIGEVMTATLESKNNSFWNLMLPAILGSASDETVPTVTSPATGRVWMDRNLGASRVATSMTDTEAYGSLYQWGRLTDGHEKRNSSTTTTLSSTDDPGHGNFIVNTSEPYDWRTSPNNNLWQGKSGINNPCPSGFRLPTESELQAEVDSWSSKDAAGAFGSVLKMPAADYRNFESGTLVYEAISGVYWTSTIDESQTDGHNIPGLFFNNSGYADMSSFGHVLGGSVRCIQD
ncbi:M6 family metalloprotease domain-containing protein [Candidatus Electrothrix sp.]|uniref:M6 family metalloprotease domain-containing protein n=1 Tax=Candidatus Electrothrix sp. TaxID=2170559 RepID=UPI004057CB0C